MANDAQGGIPVEKYSLFIILVALTLVFLGGCSAEKTDRVAVTKMESFSVEKGGSLTIYTDRDTVDGLVNAFKKTRKVRGIADVSDPEYKVDFGTDTYYLWLGEEKGSIMNADDTHTLYTLSKRATKTIKEIIN